MYLLGNIPLIPSACLEDDEDITVKMKVDVVPPGLRQIRDPMSCMISDGDFAVGIQLLDPNQATPRLVRK